MSSPARFMARPAARAGLTGLMLAGLLATSLAGCSSDPKQGYSFASTHSTNIQTISVPVFQNTTYATGIEAELADALVKEIQRTTRWAVVSSSASDTELSGTITSAQLDRLSVQTDTGLVQELAYRIRIDFEFRDNRSGKVITSRRNFETLDTFVASRTSSERLEIGQVGAVQRLAKQVVAELRDAW